MTRRTWISSLLGTGAAVAYGAPATPRPRVACIMNVYGPNTHADVFVSRLLDGYRLNGAWHSPHLQTVNFYVDQFPFNDMAREQAAEYGIRICPSISEAAHGVDGIAVIGEHGEYPRTTLGNFSYPRKRYFDEIMKLSHVPPLFSDKYLAYDWKDARAMYDTVRERRIPFLCGSTVPLSWQRPPWKPGKPEEFVAVTYSDIEEHAYHGIEAMQSIAEKRGETGVEAVRYLEGPAVWDIAPDLREAALAKRVNPPPEDKGQKPQAFQIRYRDGLRASVLHLNSKTRDYLLAARMKGEPNPQATCFYIGLYTHSHWGFLVKAFEDLVLTKREQMPIERTLLTNGILLAGLDSRRKGGAWVDTPDLAISYSWPR